MAAYVRALIACFGIATLAAPVMAGDASGPEGQKVEIDNKFVRVYRARLPGHGKVAMRDYVGSCVVYLADVDELVTSPDGQVNEIRHKYGDVGRVEPDRYSVENLTRHSTEEVMIELKAERGVVRWAETNS